MSKTTRRSFLAGAAGAATLGFPMIAKGQAADGHGAGSRVPEEMAARGAGLGM